MTAAAAVMDQIVRWYTYVPEECYYVFYRQKKYN